MRGQDAFELFGGDQVVEAGPEPVPDPNVELGGHWLAVEAGRVPPPTEHRGGGVFDQVGQIFYDVGIDDRWQHPALEPCRGGRVPQQMILGADYLSARFDHEEIPHKLVYFDGGVEDKLRERIEQHMLPFFSRVFGAE